MAHVEDRWYRPSAELDGRGRPKKVKTPRYGRGKRWVAIWHEGGRRKSLSFDTEDGARAYLAKVTVDQAQGTHVSRHRETVAEFGDRWVSEQLHQRPSSRAQMESRWRNHIRPKLGHLGLQEVAQEHVQRVVAEWDRAGMAPSTISVCYGYTSALFKAARVKRLIAHSPCVGINLPRVNSEQVIPMTTEQVHAVAKRIVPSLRGFVWLAAATGMRQGELRGLTVDRLAWSDVLTVRVDRQLVSTGLTPEWGPPKTDRSRRSITVDPASADRLRAHLDEFGTHESGLVFWGRGGGPLARTTLATAWARATEGMALKPRSGWHELRHYHASALIAAGVSVTAVSERLGHQDPTETLRTYSHLWPSDEARARGAIERALWGVTGSSTQGADRPGPSAP